MIAFAILIIAIKLTLLWLLALYIDRHNQRESAAWQHRLLLMLLLASPVLLFTPWLGWLEIPVAVGQSMAQHWQTVESWVVALSLLYSMVFFTLLFDRIINLLQLYRQERSYRPAPDQINKVIADFFKNFNTVKNVQCVVAPSDAVFAYVWRPVGLGAHRLVLSRGVLALSPQQQSIILSHECAHIERQDWLYQQFTYCVCCLFWWFPGFWLLSRKLQHLAEQATDDLAIEQLGGRNAKLASHYAELLLDIKNRTLPTNAPTTNAVAGHRFYLRVEYLLEQFISHSSLERPEKRSVGIITVLWLLPLLLVNAELQPKTQPITPWLPVADQESEPVKSAAAVPDIIFKKPKRQNPILPPPVLNQQPQPLALEEINVIAHKPTFNPSSYNQLELPSVQWQGYLPEITASPSYPKRALMRGITGTVIAKFAIDRQGFAFNVEIVSAEPEGWFEQAVIKSINDSQFKPFTINGNPVALSDVTEAFVFKLQ